MKSILFVCMANICRSPALEAALKHMAAQKALAEPLHVDSCGIGWVRVGEHPDPRSILEAKKRGIYLDHKSQQFQDHFFEIFDFIFSVDCHILEQLKRRANPAHHSKIHLATAFSKRFQGEEIPDPYYMGEGGFAQVMDMIIDSCEGILDFIFLEAESEEDSSDFRGRVDP